MQIEKYLLSKEQFKEVISQWVGSDSHEDVVKVVARAQIASLLNKGWLPPDKQVMRRTKRQVLLKETEG